jgi:hypothetical protein
MTCTRAQRTFTTEVKTVGAPCTPPSTPQSHWLFRYADDRFWRLVHVLAAAVLGNLVSVPRQVPESRLLGD